jgi:UDP-N-acetylglucosamine 1-carboxyvinyltransferase
MIHFSHATKRLKPLNAYTIIVLMSKLIIEGGRPLRGEVLISGSKNAALPILAASLLSAGESIIENCPNLIDISVLCEILEDLGAKITHNHSTLAIDTGKVAGGAPKDKLISQLRGSVLVLGPLLARFGKVRLAHPGGDKIGPRPIDVHLNVMKVLGAKVCINADNYSVEAEKLKGAKIVLSEMSVTATENAMMAACLAEGVTEIRMAAAEPEIVNLADFLRSMGAKITGDGTHVIKVEGVNHLLGPGKITVMPDRLEAVTFAIAAAVTQGDILIKGFRANDLDAVVNSLREANVKIEILNDNEARVQHSSFLKAIKIRTDVYPGFPTDLQAPFAVLLTQANGTSTIFETMYAGRLNYALELIRMGADITLIDQHRLQIVGPTPLRGKEIDSLDIRAGATLILAGLIAEGKSTLASFEVVDRGYEKIEEKLSSLGAAVKRDEN